MRKIIINLRFLERERTFTYRDYPQKKEKKYETCSTDKKILMTFISSLQKNSTYRFKKIKFINNRFLKLH